MTGVCHADRIQALKRVGKATQHWQQMNSRLLMADRDYIRRDLQAMLEEAEAECLAAARALTQIADCSD